MSEYNIHGVPGLSNDPRSVHSRVGLELGLEHLKIETRLIDERFPSVMGECEIVTVKVCRLYLELYVKMPSRSGY